MKKYIVFAYGYYYPCGGMSDVIGSFDTLAEAEAEFAAHSYEAGEIVDRDTWEVVRDYE